MRNLIGLFDAVCEAYDNPDFVPKDGVTHCNEAVAYVANSLGCTDFELKTADEIIQLVEGSPDWSTVTILNAQDMANQGSLLIAGLNSTELGQKHGHVVVIRPGKLCFSGKWGPCPRILNIGAENFLARAKKGPLIGMAVGLNEAFVPMPKIFVWRPSL